MGYMRCFDAGVQCVIIISRTMGYPSPQAFILCVRNNPIIYILLAIFKCTIKLLLTIFTMLCYQILGFIHSLYFFVSVKHSPLSLQPLPLPFPASHNHPPTLYLHEFNRNSIIDDSKNIIHSSRQCASAMEMG